MPSQSDGNGYHCALGLPRFLLRLLGIWPDPAPESNSTSIHFFIIAATMNAFIIIPQTVKIFKSMQDINTVIELFVNCDVPVTIGFIKLSSAWYHRHVLRDLLVNMIQDWQVPRPERELIIMWRNAKLCRTISIGIFLLNNACVVTQLAQWINDFQMFKATLLISNHSDTEEWPLYFVGSFPFDTQKTPIYELTIIFQFFSVCFASFSYQSTDPFFIILMLHVIGQLSILKMAVAELPTGPSKADDGNGYLRRLVAIHTAHNRLWRFSLAIEDSFNVMFLCQIVPCMLVLCTQGYLLIVMTDAESLPIVELIFMVFFNLLFLCTIFAYCLIAEILRQKSMDIGRAVYDSDWTSLSAKDARLLVLVLARAQQPFEITMGKYFPFCLEVYCKIIKTSAGYLSVLLAARDRMLD